MAEAEPTSAADLHGAPSRNLAGVIVASATEAFASAVVLWFLGDAAISIAGSFAGGMMPSPPPGFAHQRPDAAPASGPPQPEWHLAGWAAFVLIFAIFFAHSLWTGLHDGRPAPGRRIRRILSTLRENWFGLIVGNAITAWVAVLVLGFVPIFSLSQMVWHWLVGMVLHLVGDLGRVVFGSTAAASLSAWFSWYNDNQMKLTFWVIYLGGAFDDLGVPNFKTLARWGWRRLQKPKGAALTATAGSD